MSKIGRPTEYNQEKVAKAQEYLDSCKDYDKESMLEGQPHGGALKREQRICKVNLPTKGGLARHLNVSRETLYQWAKEYDEFSDIMEQIGAEQEARLINGGLSGDYNPTISKVLLSKHGYIEKSESDMTSGGHPLGVIILPKRNADSLEADGETK